ncbi:MAG: hypothetical protein V7679_01100 [Parasphingorhabdus sp.]
MLDTKFHLQNIEDLDGRDVREAYFQLIVGAIKLGLSPISEKTAITAVRFYNSREIYLFSFILNKADLLFYLRKPALNSNPRLLKIAEGFPSYQSNNDGELTVRIQNLDDAVRVCDQIFAEAMT